MPFVPRSVQPRYVSRTSLRDASGRPRVHDEELQAVTNCTLAGALRQLASLVLLADDVFNELAVRLSDVAQRSQVLQGRVAKLDELVQQYDPKKVPVPEDSLSNFATRKVHYTAKHTLGKELFTAGTRPRCVRDLYEKATSRRLPPSLLEQLRNDSQHSPYLLCTPVLGARRRRHKMDIEIDTRIPAAVEELRKWTSKEAMGDVTVLPDASSRIVSGVTLTPEELSDCGSGDDEPIDHQLPSPEEQLQVIISKFTPEVIPIDTSGKFFDRICTSRKSLLHIESGGETDTVKRRTRSRKPRGKRRNTISGTDQKELREAIAGDTSSPVASQETPDSSTVVRSQSSDLLKKSPIDLLSKKSGHFNSLKQWGKTRLKMISRSPSASRDSFRDSIRSDKSKETKCPTLEQETVSEQQTVSLRKRKAPDPDRRPTHQRCASYSSDEKSATGVPASIPTTATISTGVKLRSCSAQRRLRRAGISKEEPHSSSGNWSASSESGRTSIGSEITTTTVPPKSTTSAATSNNSLNTHAHGPPSSIISRRRFLNTSGSGSVTSEGTLTPDIIHDLHEDLETSSEYSCDTEGYYTSFHMDSGLKTLKEEDSPSTPMHTSNALSNSSTSQNITAENEYELFGKGSTSTTTSSAGTVCTTLMAAGSDRSLVIGPTVPERKSSLTKLNRNRGSIHSANASLDRNFTSSTENRFNSLRFHRDVVEKTRFNYSMPSTNELPEATITITNNVGKPQETVLAIVHHEPEIDSAKKSTGTSSPDSGHNTSSSPIEDSVSSAQGKHSLSEQDYSESSDLEGTDRIERIRYKTTINSSRIPSLCVITPSNSDDESITSHKDSEEIKLPVVVEMHKKISTRPKLELPSEALVEPKTKECSKESSETVKPPTVQKHTNLKNSLMPLNNLMCRLKGVLPHKLSHKKSPILKEPEIMDNLYDSGDYVTIADVRNNNQKMNMNIKPGYESNDLVKKNLQTVLSGKLQETEYISLNELPNCLAESKDFLENNSELRTPPAHEEFRQRGAKVTLDSQGKVIYSSDSIRRKKGAHTTFEPGPFVKDVKIPGPDVTLGYSTDTGTSDSDETDATKQPLQVPTSPQLGKVIIKAPIERDGPVTTEIISLPAPKPSTIITAAPIPDRTINLKPEALKHDLKPFDEGTSKAGAYVNIQDAEGVSLSPTRDNSTDYRRSPADKPYVNVVSKPPRTHLQQNVNQPIPAVTDQRKPFPITAIDPRRPPNTGSPQPETFHRDNSTYWTLRPQKNTQDWNQPTVNPQYNSLHRQRNIPQAPLRQYPYQPTQQQQTEESLKISPIDPRASAPFHSSTPSKDAVIDLSARILSPVKSSMSNEELYAVIHKSKKKLNIKEQDRCDSPALSTISLSPVNSESSLAVRPSPKHPESGYFVDPRTRNSWASAREDPRLNPTRTAGTVGRPESTCADRLGPIPQTSRMDFKKLLLQHGVRLNTLSPQQNQNKISAVEQLKLNKMNPIQQTPIPAQMNILDLSSSPKLYSHRKMTRSAPSTSSPNRTSALIKEHKSTPKIMLSPKSQWRFSSPRSDVLSSPIPEANNEDETSNSSGEKHDSPLSTIKTVPIITNQHFGARRNLIPINENLLETDCDFVDFSSSVKPIQESPDARMQHGVSRSKMLQAKRAEFFNSSPESSPPRFTSFKTPASTDKRTSPDKRTPSPPALETAL